MLLFSTNYEDLELLKDIHFLDNGNVKLFHRLMSIQEQLDVEQAIAHVKTEKLQPSEKVVALIQQGKLELRSF